MQIQLEKINPVFFGFLKTGQLTFGSYNVVECIPGGEKGEEVEREAVEHQLEEHVQQEGRHSEHITQHLETIIRSN